MISIGVQCDFELRSKNQFKKIKYSLDLFCFFDFVWIFFRFFFLIVFFFRFLFFLDFNWISNVFFFFFEICFFEVIFRFFWVSIGFQLDFL